MHMSYITIKDHYARNARPFRHKYFLICGSFNNKHFLTYKESRVNFVTILVTYIKINFGAYVTI